MSLSVADFINGRCAEHDFIRNSWRSLQRTMTMSDIRRMQRLIEQPGFCVKKFEETYLLKRLNPFAQNEEQRHISFSHLDCECGKAQNARDITAMKNQMSQFLEKWEDMMYQWQNDQPESYASDDYYEDDDLRQNTSMEEQEVQPVPAQKLVEIQKPAVVQKPVDIQKSVEVQKPAVVQKHEVFDNQAKAQKNEAEKQPHKPGSAVAEQCLWNVAHVSGQPAHSKNVAENPMQNKNAPSTSSIKASDVVISSKAAEQGSDVAKAEKDTAKAPKIDESPKPTSSKLEQVPSVKPTETKKEVSSGSVKATNLQVVVPAKSDAMKEVVAAANIQKTTAEPEAARTNTASSLPVTLSQEEPISVACTEETASLPSPLTQDGISPAITDISRTAGSPDSGMISDISEFKNMESEKTENESKEKDPAKMTGRDGRRYRKKLEAEKMAAEQSRAEEKSEGNPARASTESVGAESEEAVMTGKEKRRFKDKMRKEKKEQEKLEELMKEKEAAHQTKAKGTSETTASAEPSVDDAPSTSSPEKLDDAIVGPGLGAVDLAQEGTSEAVSVDSNAPNMESYSEVAEEGAEEQPKKLSKSQKKRAYKKAKGVYVVNENKKGHSVELLPGEYKIVKLDQSPRKADASEGGDGQAGMQSVEGSPNQQNKKVNFYVAGNLSKDILDNGKWLAYVIDDKNADGTPRIGEVDTEEVEKTIRLLDSQLTHSEQNVGPFVDDFDYNTLMSDKDAEQFVSQIAPELDPDYIRKVLAKSDQAVGGAGESLCPIEAMMDDYLPDMTPDDLENYLNYDANKIVFKTEFARRTAPLFVGNNQFKEFCIKYSKSKFDPKTIHTLIKKYIDARIVFHYEKFKKFADYEARRISACWGQVSENSPYALMVMLFINNKDSSVNFADIEKVLFPEI
ncbi:hypothetical protein CAEBREN_09483 [Caenorhabditis brenneri]|uniref:Uncharacterized protein n=1 Tax=Caenorhabditis brenneri TaxID=135651 RepID=G0MST3_CAEBE|nr:hypothetical protein CAEBREN_09483 [Caenorhabditis brenneri]